LCWNFKITIFISGFLRKDPIRILKLFQKIIRYLSIDTWDLTAKARQVRNFHKGSILLQLI